MTRPHVLLVAAVVALAAGLLWKAPLVRALTPGEALTVELARNYKLETDRSAVKLAGAPVGVVADVEEGPDGTVAVELDLDPGTRDLLGAAPSAQIRPTTVLGGSYYVSLVPGGGPGVADLIPVARTRTPVELDLLLSAIPPDAQSSLQGASRLFDASLAAGAGDALGGLLETAPATLDPAAAVLDAARGARPDTDLADLVTDLRAVAATATAREGELPSIVDGLAATAGTLARGRDDLAAAVATLPETLDATRAGADDVRETLVRLARTADDLGPTADELDPLLAELRPALAELRPVLAGLRPVLDDARPLVADLLPVADHGREVFDDVRGPVLDRVTGPIIGSLNSEFRGVGPKYPDSGGVGHPFYEEIGYLATSINGGVKTYDRNGSMISFQVGLGTSSLVNAPVGPEALVARLAELAEGAR